MKSEFSFYDFVGVVAPGALVLFGATYLFPAIGEFKSLPNMELGGLGVFAALAYVAGQLMQAVGNVIESIYWRSWGGMPSQWVLKGKLLSASQLKRLGDVATARFGIPDLGSANPKGWYSISREINARVISAGRERRLNVFNGNYGLMRGIAAAALVLVVATLAIKGTPAWRAEALLAGAAGVALYRMHRFGVNYARELFVQYLDLDLCAPKPS